MTMTVRGQAGVLARLPVFAIDRVLININIFIGGCSRLDYRDNRHVPISDV